MFPVERELKVLEEQRYEKTVEVDQKKKQIGSERNAADRMLTETLPAEWSNVKQALKEITLEVVEAEIGGNGDVPEIIQVDKLLFSRYLATLKNCHKFPDNC